MPLKKPIAAKPGTLFTTRPYDVPGLVGTRRCTLYLPPGYFEDTARHYPVAYMFDGQNMFGDETSFSGGWHLHERLNDRAARKKVVPIVVAIHHGNAHRADDLSPWGVGRGHHGHADDLFNWLTGTLMRFVAEDLRILHGPENTLIGGSSLGGLAALYGYIRHPDVFGRVLAMSPSLWVHRGALIHLAAQAQLRPGARVYIDCGAREGRGMMHLAEVMAHTLEGKGLVDGRSLMWRPDQRGSHNERNWRRRLPKALRFLYDEKKERRRS